MQGRVPGEREGAAEGSFMVVAVALAAFAQARAERGRRVAEMDDEGMDSLDRGGEGGVFLGRDHVR